jgi:hypothetical protein
MTDSVFETMTPIAMTREADTNAKIVMFMKAALTETNTAGMSSNDKSSTLDSAMSCPHGRGNTPQKVGYDESVSNLMFNEESGWMTAHVRRTRLWIIVQKKNRGGGGVSNTPGW